MEESVKKLLDAEKKANEIVERAMSDKQNKMVEAKMEAEKEISRYKDEQEAEFEIEKEEQHRKINDLSHLDEEVAEEIKIIKEEYETNKKEVIKFLLDSIKNVPLQPPRGLKGDFEGLEI
uniref:V-type proton ATPase subunit G n=1 Tax=Euplotes harpa TaxID=151035 RepID=A0A7S3J971_9SPIT|mmetsp:Transcript_24518/g.28200  ORF Transcript_24518/g.28200 Transcript_24518/m.28200 type:complete len:120 (+) Transcript_24518:25-384(+)